MDFHIDESVAVLSRTPRTLHALLHDLPSSWTAPPEAPGKWSASMVVAHLLLADQTNWMPRARTILGEGARSFAALDPEAQLRAVAPVHLNGLLTAFAQLRADNLAELASWNLTEAQLHRTGEHPEFGTVTLRQLLATWTAHDLSHVAQIARVMAVQYREAVGPWSAYLRVMRE